MTTQHYSLTVTDVPIRIATGTGGDHEVHVYLSNGTGDDCYIGDSSVTSTGTDVGYVLHKYVAGVVSSRAEFTLSSTDELWAVAAATKSTTLTILLTNV